MTIGDRIKMVREEKHMTQNTLGKEVNLSGVAIMRYEKGLREPKLETLNKIAQALGVSTSYLLGIDDIKAELEKVQRAAYTYQNLKWAQLEEKLAHVGWKIDMDEDNAAIMLYSEQGTLDVTEEELLELNDELDGYIRFKLDMLIRNHRKDFHPNKKYKSAELDLQRLSGGAKPGKEALRAFAHQQENVVYGGAAAKGGETGTDAIPKGHARKVVDELEKEQKEKDPPRGT